MVSFTKSVKVRYSLLLLPAAVLLYIMVFHPFYFILYPYSAINPYVYYSYSPGFWSVDFSFWIFLPIYYKAFRQHGNSRIISLVYVLCLDASAVGIFLTFFSLVYGISIFASAYYTYTFVLMLMFIPPALNFKVKLKSLAFLAVFPVAGIIWKLSVPGNVGYFLSPSVIIDLFMIWYCFFIFVPFLSLKSGNKTKGEVKNEIAA